MLTFPKFIGRSLLYHWRGNLAVLLGVAVGSAVLTGALLVGDSLRGSLRARVERQLAGIDAAAMFPRPVRADLSNSLPGQPAPVLMLPGSLQAVGPDEITAPFLGRVTVMGIDNGFRPAETPTVVNWAGAAKVIVLSDRVAGKLAVKVGDKVKLNVERFSDLPRSSALAKRGSPDVTATEELTVAVVLPPDAPGQDFNLTPNPAAPLNVFLPIQTLSAMVRPRDPDGRTRRDDIVLANVFLSRGIATDALNAPLRSVLTPEDYGLKFREIDRGYLSVETSNLVFPPATVAAVEAAAKELGLRAEPTAIYIADTIAHGGREIPYPVVAGLNPTAAAPLGPFLPPGVATLADDEMVLLDWKGSELNGLPVGSKLRVDYFDPEVEGEGKRKTAELTLRGYIPLSGAAQDRDLVPEIRGVTDVRANLKDWDRPPVLPKDEIKRRVPDTHPRAVFFNTGKPPNKATPMAYVNLATATKLFGSRYGSVTSVRVAPAAGESLEQTSERLQVALLKHLDPKSAGLTFEPIRERLLTASKGGTDFGGLFLGFSCFLIAAALMLVGLLFRLTLDRRAKEVGLLLATGYSVRQVRRLLLFEGMVLALVGALIGLALGVAYNRLLLAVLLELWPDKGVANVLRPHTTPLSFALGFGLTVLMALGALWLSVRGLVKVPPPALLRGETQVATISTASGSRAGWWLALGCIPVGLALIVAGKFFSNPDYQAMTFFAGGGLLLTAGLAAAWTWMKRTRHATVSGRGLPALGQLGSRNAARNPARSLLTAALLAAAAFLLVAVESFRRQTGAEFLDKNGGSGGFNLIAEADVPIYDPIKLDGIEEIYALRLRDGDDASCMNLFQASRPRVLGITDELIQRGGFKFYATDAHTKQEDENPWILLRKPFRDHIPVFCEQNTAQWMLKTGIAGVITMTADDGREIKLRIAGTFTDSPFQSELVMSDEAFAWAFPKTGGHRVFLVRTQPDKEEAVGRALANKFRANGLIVTPTRERVAAYQAVIGAYLSTFQLLGGLGLLLGVLGLAVVVLRSVWERVGELALLRAVGYRTRQLQFLVLAENALLLVAGLGIGVLAALASVAPHVAEGAAVPWARLVGILALVLVVGLGVASAATAGILRVPVIPALRRE
jgi:ABC-type antimicrobial peptide transport system permease subunit